MTLRWGIVSTGRHPDLKIVPALKLAGETKVEAVCSREVKEAEAFAARHGIPRAYGSFDELLQDPGVDAVHIASPNFLHARQTIRAAEAGKHVLVEKPMAVGVEEAVDMVRTCRARGVKLGVGLHLRHHPGHRKARRLIEEKVLGVITMAQAQWCLGTRGVVEPPARTGRSEWWARPDLVGGAYIVMGTGTHAIDLLHLLTGQPIVEVAAVTDGQTAERPLEQAAAISVRFAGGGIGAICCGRRMPDSENDAMIYGTNGKVALRGTLAESRDGQLEVESESIHLSESYEQDRLALYRLQAEAFQRSVEKGEEFHASGEDGLLVVQVTSAIIESASSGRTVKIEPIRL